MKYSFLILTCVLLFGCSNSATVSDVVNHPRDYLDKEVSVRGKASEPFSLVLVNYFWLKEMNDSIAVVTTRPVPAPGEEVQVAGKIHYMTLGTMRMLVLEETARNSD